MDLCGNVKLKLAQVVEPLLSKRSAAAFKYLYAYLLNYEYVASLRSVAKAVTSWTQTTLA